DSVHAPELKQALDDFEAERKRVQAGEAKLDGRWLSKEEIAREKYQIAASQWFNAMKSLAARGDLVGALNTFDALEKQYPASRVYPDAIDLALRVMGALEPDLDRRLQIVKADYDKLVLDWKTMTPENRAE